MLKINIGSGDSTYEDYINLDHDPLSSPDHVINLETDKLPFDDNSVEAVIAHHVLEHLGEGYFHCLKELYRVCAHGAIIDIRVPHPRHDAFLADPTHKRPITVMGLKLFSKKFNQLSREQQYSSSRLAEYHNVDFEILDFKYVPDKRVAVKTQNMNEAQLQEYSDECCNVIAEIHIRLTVIKHA